MSSPTSLKESQASTSSQEPSGEGIETLNTRSLTTAACLDMMSTAVNSEMQGKKVIGDYILKYMCKQKGWNSPVGSFAGISTCIQSYQIWALIMTFCLSELGILKIQCFKFLSTLDEFFYLRLIHPVLHLQCCPFFLDCWKHLASEQDLFSEFKSKVALSQSWDMMSYSWRH